MKIMSIELVRNWGVDIFVYLIYMYVFISEWIYKKDIEIDGLGAVSLVTLICVLPLVIISEVVIFKNNKVDEEVEQIISILPIIKEELILGRLINSGFILYTLIIPYITMYIFTPSVTQMIGVRGGLTLLIIYLVVWATIRTISKYHEKYKILSKILGGIFIILLLLNVFMGIVFPWQDMLKTLYVNEFFTLIGNTYVGIILGILTLIGFYYFNFRYILKGIKNNRWQIR
jgi:hypothetical protein